MRKTSEKQENSVRSSNVQKPVKYEIHVKPEEKNHSELFRKYGGISISNEAHVCAKLINEQRFLVKRRDLELMFKTLSNEAHFCGVFYSYEKLGTPKHITTTHDLIEVFEKYSNSSIDGEDMMKALKIFEILAEVKKTVLNAYLRLVDITVQMWYKWAEVNPTRIRIEVKTEADIQRYEGLKRLEALFEQLNDAMELKAQQEQQKQQQQNTTENGLNHKKSAKLSYLI